MDGPFGKIRFLFGFDLLNLWTFAVSFPNGGSTLHIKYMTDNVNNPYDVRPESQRSFKCVPLYIASTAVV